MPEVTTASQMRSIVRTFLRAAGDHRRQWMRSLHLSNTFHWQLILHKLERSIGTFALTVTFGMRIMR
jgi:hypothetical protein